MLVIVVKAEEESWEGPKIIKIKILDPCSQMKKIGVEYPSVLYRVFHPSALEKHIGSSSFNIYIEKSCKYLYGEHIIPLIEQVQNCNNNKKKRKRSILSKLKLVETVLLIITDFINIKKATSDLNNYETSLQLLEEPLETLTTKFLKSKELMLPNIIKQIERVSSSALKHQKYTDKFATQMPLEGWGYIHIMSELIAGAANLKAIVDHCKNQQVATTELGEILNDENISQTNPNDTIIEDIRFKNDTLSIKYYIKTSTKTKEIEVVLTGQKVLLTIIAAIIILILIGIIVYVYIKIKEDNLKETEEEIDEIKDEIRNEIESIM